ncbi:MAG: NADH pyrophosphatase zinc ribbon domain-containing protein [Hyphomicrobiales bacterium]
MTRLKSGELPEDSGTGGVGPEVFLGLELDGARPVLAAHAADGAVLEGLRSLMLKGTLAASELSVLAQGRSLIHWHERHGFCANCGAKTEMADSGYRRTCAAAPVGRSIFPAPTLW